MPQATETASAGQATETAGQVAAAGLDPGERGGERAGSPAGEDRAEYGQAERPADRPEEGHPGRGGAQIGVFGGILHGDDQHLQDQAEAEPEQEEIAVDDQRRGVLGQAREQVPRDGEQRCAHDLVDLVPAEPGDQLAGADRGDQHAEHHRQQIDPGDCRRYAPDYLQEQRQVTYGLDLQAWCVYMIAAHHIPVHRCADLIADLSGAKPSPRFVNAMIARAGAASLPRTG
jgi:hypothetical protein